MTRHSDCRDFKLKLYRGSDLTEHTTPTSALSSHSRQKHMVLSGLGPRDRLICAKEPNFLCSLFSGRMYKQKWANLKTILAPLC